MNKKLFQIVGISFFIGIIAVLVLLIPRDDICSDDIRGYESKATSSLSAVRENFSSIKSIIEVEKTQDIPQLEGLSVSNFPALRACDIHCKLLRQCLRFVFVTPPSQACPTEYSDFKGATKSALILLEKLNQLELSTERAAQEADKLATVQKDIKEIEKTSGSTGGRLVVLKARAQHTENNLGNILFAVNKEINVLTSQNNVNISQ